MDINVVTKLVKSMTYFFVIGSEYSIQEPTCEFNMWSRSKKERSNI